MVGECARKTGLASADRPLDDDISALVEFHRAISSEQPPARASASADAASQPGTAAPSRGRECALQLRSPTAVAARTLVAAAWDAAGLVADDGSANRRIVANRDQASAARFSHHAGGSAAAQLPGAHAAAGAALVPCAVRRPR